MGQEPSATQNYFNRLTVSTRKLQKVASVESVHMYMSVRVGVYIFMGMEKIQEKWQPGSVQNIIYTQVPPT